MRGLYTGLAVAIAMLAALGLAQQGSTTGPYKVVKTAKVGGSGGWDYVYADADARRLYIARTGPMPRMTVYNLDTLEPAGEIPTTNSHGAVVDSKSNHGFISSKPILMFDSKTLMPIKSIEVQGNPDGMLFDPAAQRVYILSHQAPHVTAIDAKDGSVIGTVDLGGMPEQAATDGQGHMYVDVEDKANIAVVDTKTLTVTAHYDLTGKGGTCAGLALDAKNHILFSACRNPANMVMLNADNGNIITTDRHRHRRRRIQPEHDGSVQLAGRRHAHDHQGKQPDQLCGRTDRANDERRQNFDLGYEDQPNHPDHRRDWSAHTAQGARRTRGPGSDCPGFIYDPRRR